MRHSHEEDLERLLKEQHHLQHHEVFYFIVLIFKYIC
jgi:hypothetical protein